MIWATHSQARYIEDLWLDSNLSEEEMFDLLAETHQGGYDMHDMPSVKRAVRYMSRAEASKVIDHLKSL